ncbi:MAG: ATP-binding protein [Muribaculaceae bacterium]|nr:ATP-binding protein [Muribaculaceae bacterium]
MARTIKYPVGIQTFSEIITENYLYVDKTAIIYDLVKDRKYIFLSRPRRFGKSLLMSTLEAYFKGERELFDGLAISKLETQWETYPVFRFDLSGENFNSVERLIDHIKNLLEDIEEQYEVKLEGSIAQRFTKLIKLAYKRFGKKVVILIDEYDKPMLDCLHNDALHEEIKAELRGFYSVMKASDQYIKFAMITGVTKFGKVSIFSGMNNLKDISLLPKYNDLCGISESEFHRDFGKSIEEFAEENNLSTDETWDEFKALYDGYHFASRGEYIYNPFSVLNAFDSEETGHYWFDSGSPSYLIYLIKKNYYLLANLEGTLRKKSALSDISDIRWDIVPLLFQSGYLTIKSYDKDRQEYTLGFPNREVYESFWESLANHFFHNRVGDSTFNVDKFVSDVNEGRPEKFMERLRSLFADTESEHEPNKEIHFQNMMAIACKMMGLAVSTEIHSSMGRCDMQIDTPAYVYIFEFKVDGSAEEAMRQIHEKGYAGRFGADPRTVFLIGANFSTKTRTLTTPCLIETLSKNSSDIL